MVATFSPHRDTGGTLHLHSPTGMHHVDAGSAIRQLRRSLSRSPSKNSDFRLMPSRNHSPSSKNAPFVSSPLSPSARRSSGNLFLVPPSQNQSPLAIPFPPSAKINRPGLRRTGTLQSARSRANPTSPAKRVLSDSRDNGNSTPAQAGGSPSWEEPPMKKDSNSQSHHSGLESTSPTSPTEDPADNLLAPKPAHPRIEKRRSGNFGPFSSTSSPLKRSDGIMNLDQASLGSPSAKRRSLHGASYGPDFNIFDHECGAQSPAESSELNTGQFEQRQPPQLQPSDPTPGPPQHYFSTIPKRSSSLRKSTLQQRQSGSFFSRAKGYSDASTDPSTPNPMAPKTRQRMSLDGHLFSPNTRDPPFSPQNLFSNTPASTTPPTPAAPQNPPSQFHHPAHPLSRTITQSSSSSSIADDSPTHEPLRRSERPRPLLNFSKSLPAGSARPGFGQPAREESNETTDSFATPNNYKLVKPLPAAFMSTGLISKKNRNADDPSLGNSKNMPDTPCKRQSNIIPGVARDFPEKSMEKSKQSRHPFAPPSTPAPSNSNAGPAPRGTGIFGASLNRPSISRRGSFVSIDGDDRSQPQSPAQHSSQSTIDSDLPPTPTKQSSVSHGSQLFSRSRMNQADRTQQLSGHKGSSCKLSSIEPFPHGEDGDSDSVMEDSPSAYLGHKSSDTTIPFPSSIPRSRPMRNLNSPTPIPNNSFVSSSPSHINHVANTKLDRPYAASPLFNKFEQATPHTPQEHILPPDPSGLSISVHSDQRLSQREQDSSALPATPTAPREYFAPVGKQSTLSLSGYHVANVDTSLTSRFEKVELVGTGEFSQVYRVTEAQKSSSFQSIFSLPSNGSNGSPNSNPERVCAVKKSKHPYVGVKDRQRRIQEVDVLKSLKDSDHIISFMDSWEDKNHLYIQTEFCEEGSLDMFLAQVGLKARLDDFRIWKILLELSLGLKHIHDSGFIHLDLKPANILITFEGVLKIADFGMATRWPAAAGIEGEGDREYIGPEILMGRYDKPADVFALGLIMFETAGNVELPDNGLSWQKLRNGDMSDVPSLTWTSGMSNIVRDSTGNPLAEDVSFEELCASDLCDDEFGQPEFNGFKKHEGKSVKTARSGELTEPPTFMVDATNEQALDKIVRWMISPDPADRPVADQIIQTYGVQWAESRRRAGATVYEGNWGPADEVLAEDAEMIDV